MKLDFNKIIKEVKKNIQDKGIKPLILILIIGVLFIIISSPTKKVTKDNKKEYSSNGISKGDDDSYKKELEKELVSIIKRVNGVIDASVMITLKSSSLNLLIP